MNDYKIIAISGGSGSGKTAVLQQLDGTVIADREVKVMTSVTTRALRDPNEAYRRTITEEEFNMLCPHMAQCITFSGHSYGILKDEIDSSLINGNIVFADVVAEGVKQLESHYPGSVQAVFLYVRPSVLLRRLLERKASPAEIRERLELSAQQLLDAISSGLYVFIENVDMERTIESIQDLLMRRPVETIVPDYDEYLAELKEVMAEWDTTTCDA